MKKPGLPKGTRDFLPAQAGRRKYIFDTIEKVFINYGFQLLETPAMENLDTLLGKYGDEGDKLLFKILNSGDYLKDVSENDFKEKNANQISSQIAEKGLRYDLTIPFARLVAMNQHAISFPFKRYQMQAVWRADRPQRGRYREFVQCDADVVGSDSLMYEAELLQIYDLVFTALKIPVQITINHRKILEGISIQAACEDKFMSMTMILDKLDKIGLEEVQNLLVQNGIEIDKAQWILNQVNEKNLNAFNYNEQSKKAVSELEFIFAMNQNYNFNNPLVFDASLARGLTYYTGCIFEIIPMNVKMGSLGGGGRYDNLTGVFGLPGVSGVGISFGADRIYDVIEELKLFPEGIHQHTRALFISLDEESLKWSYNLASKLRSAGLSVDLYPEVTKIKKQFAYAENLQIPFVIIVGETERNAGMVNIKNQRTGEQIRTTSADIASYIC